MTKSTSKLTAGQTVVLQARMSVIPGGVDGDSSIKRFSRHPGETEFEKDHPVTFVGYRKLSIKGKTKNQPVVMLTINGTPTEVWAYRDHLEETDQVADPAARLMILNAKAESLRAQLEACEAEIADAEDAIEVEEPTSDEGEEPEEFEDELDDDTLE